MTSTKNNKHQAWIPLALFIAAAFVLAGCQTPARTTPRVTPARHTKPARTYPYVPLTPPRQSSSYPRQIPYIGPVVLIVDPGHGGNDPGGHGYGPTPEKDIVLKIALDLADLLAEKGANVIMTRSNDRFVTLDDRAALADRYQADLLISIHADAFREDWAHGTTILIGKRASYSSKRAAQSIQNALENAGIDTRPIRAQSLRVCDAHSRPAVLIECGFLTNPTDAQNLSSPTFRQQLTQAIARGIADYFNN